VFLLPSIVLGVMFALVLGGRLSRLVEIEFRHGWSVFAALGLQLVLFAGAASPGLATPIHLGSYGLLFVFAFANARNLALLPLSLGMAMNSAAIVANGGHMPVDPDAAAAAGLSAVDGSSNVKIGGEHLTWLGDVFALPERFPLTNVFSLGDILIGIGMVGLIVAVATGGGPERALVAGRMRAGSSARSASRPSAGSHSASSSRTSVTGSRSRRSSAGCTTRQSRRRTSPGSCSYA
jgi:hypothetical protein